MEEGPGTPRSTEGVGSMLLMNSPVRASLFSPLYVPPRRNEAGRNSPRLYGVTVGAAIRTHVGSMVTSELFRSF